MISEEQMMEVRGYLERAENPLFFFDDDPDGLAAYLVLKRRYQKGRGVCVKASPTAEEIYVRKIREYSPDVVVVLDRPVLSQELIDQLHVPLVWIDHHEPLERKGAHYYNPMVPDRKDNRSTSYWAYRIAGQKELMWVAMVGIVGDWQIPEFIEEFPYKELFNGKRTPPEILFASEFGTLVKVFSFILKGETSEVRRCMAMLETINSPYEILHQETPKGKYLYKRFVKVNKEYEILLSRALEEKTRGDVYVFVYPSTKTSFTGVLSNELLFRLKNQVLMIGREKEGDVRLSLRGRDVAILPILKKVLPRVHGYGGGHEMACGAGIKKEDFEVFVRLFKDEVRKARRG